jgi:predicted amidohydrolase
MIAGVPDENWATSGNHVAFFDPDGIPSTVIVCHDERYPELVRLSANAKAEVLTSIIHRGCSPHFNRALFVKRQASAAPSTDLVPNKPGLPCASPLASRGV